MTPTEVVLRPVGDDEHEAMARAVAEVHLSARKAAVPLIPPSPHPPSSAVPHFAEVLADPEVETWVAQDAAGRVVAYACLTETWLDDLYVLPSHTGQGIGGALLALAQQLRPCGFDLWVFESNVPARRFYARAGLVEVLRTDGSDNAERAPDVRMQWPGSVPALRARVDAVDDSLAELLAERSALTARIQRAKQAEGQAAGPAARDPAREAEIARRMALRAPELGEGRLGAIMDAVITQSLDAAATTTGRGR